MATVISHPAAVPPMPAVARILSRYDRAQLVGFIEVAVGLLDILDGDDDVEPNGDELDDPGDLHDNAYTEWHTRGRHKLARGQSEEAPHVTFEDAEDDDPDTGVEDDPKGFDPEEDRCLAGDDGVFGGPAVRGNYLGFASSPDLRCLAMDEDMEREQMKDDVPCLPIHALEPNIFNGKRELLGYTLPHYRNGKLEPEL